MFRAHYILVPLIATAEYNGILINITLSDHRTCNEPKRFV